MTNTFVKISNNEIHDLVKKIHDNQIKLLQKQQDMNGHVKLNRKMIFAGIGAGAIGFITIIGWVISKLM